MRVLKSLIAITAAPAATIGVLAPVLVPAGFRPFILRSEPMGPIHTKGSLCWANARVGLDSVEVGDVLACRSPANTLVPHRLVDKSSSADTSSLPVTMRGDANGMSQDVTLSSINFIGREAFTIPRLGMMVEHILSGNAIWSIVAAFALLAAVPREPVHRRECVE